MQIIRRANEVDEDPFSLSSRFCEEYLVDMNSLQCLQPTYQPRVTEHIEHIQDMITQVFFFLLYVDFIVDQFWIITISLSYASAVRILISVEVELPSAEYVIKWV